MKYLLITILFFTFACEGLYENKFSNEKIQEVDETLEIRTFNLKFSISEDVRNQLSLQSKEFSLQNFINALNNITEDSEYTMATDWQDGEHTENDNVTIFYNSEHSFIRISDKQYYNITEDTGIETNIVEDVIVLLEGLGSSILEVDEPQVRYLSAYSIECDPKKGEVFNRDLCPVTQTKLYYKVFINRVVDGIPVEGSKLVVTFALDGSFRAITARWKPYNWFESITDVNITKVDFENKLINFLRGRNLLNIAKEYGVDATTCFVPDGDIVVLKGCVDVFKFNGQGGGIYDRYQFDLR